MKFTTFFVSILTLITCSQLHADNCNTCGPCEYETCCNPCDGWSFHADWLYWRTRKCGLDYLWPADVTRYDIECGDGNIVNTGNTVTTPTLINGSVITLGKGKPKEVDPDYDHGFRVGVFKDCNDWGLGARYTYYTSDESNSFTKGNTPYTPSRMHPDIKGFVDGINVSSAKSKYDIDLQVIELEARRSWEYDCTRTINFFGGVKLAFIDQDLDTSYTGLSINTSTGNYTLNAPDTRIHTVKEKVDMDAYGLYLGAEGHWDLCRGFGLFGRASGGALLSHFDRSFYEKEITDPSDTTPLFSNVVLVDVKDDPRCIISHFEFAAGAEYHFCDFGCGDWSLLLGYEFHQWNNMRNFLSFVDHHEKGAVSRDTEGLGFDGLFFRINVAF